MYKTKLHLSCDLRRWCRSTLGGAKIENMSHLPHTSFRRLISFDLEGNFEFVSFSFQPSKAINKGAWSL